jgi:hypothetical protein
MESKKKKVTEACACKGNGDETNKGNKIVQIVSKYL